MTRYILLLRGINVGGNNKIAMSDLKMGMESRGYVDVVTYINSGNVIFSSEVSELDILKRELEALLLEDFNLHLNVVVLTTKDFLETFNQAPSWWDSKASDKNNAIFVIPPLTAEVVIQNVGACKPEFEKVASYGNVIFWTAPMETFSKTRWSKVVKSSVYEGITIRNANTVKKLMTLCKSGGTI